jgi:hypothetical protein
VHQKYAWAGASIIAIWLAVLVVGVAGPDFRSTGSRGGTTEVPVVWGVALFAAIATVAVALRGFRD